MNNEREREKLQQVLAALRATIRVAEDKVITERLNREREALLATARTQRQAGARERTAHSAATGRLHLSQKKACGRSWTATWPAAAGGHTRHLCRFHVAETRECLCPCGARQPIPSDDKVVHKEFR